MATKKELKTVLSLEGEKAYSDGLKRIQSALGNVATEHALLNSQYEKGDKSLSKLTRQQDLLQRKLDEQRKKVELINKAYQESARHGEATAAVTQSLANELNMANAAVNRTQRELDSLNKELEHVNSRAYQFAEAMKSMNVNAQSVGNVMQNVGDKVSKVSLAIAGAVTATSVKGWMTLEDEMANVATIADTSQKSMAELTDEAISASNATGVAAADIAKAQYQAISANVATADSAALVTNAAKAAKAGVSDVTTVIDGATSIINGWGIAVEKSESVFDKLLKTQQRGKTTIGELASSIGQVTGLAPQLNISLDETLAAVGALTQNGVATSTAMNGLKAVMSAIIKPTAEAKEEAERLGLQFDSAAIKAKGFTGFLADVVAKTGGSEESMAKLFGSVEGLSQIMLLGGSAGEMYADILDDLGNSAGTLTEMFDTRTSSAAQRFSMSLNKIRNAAINLGESLAPMIDVAADSIEGFADAIQGMSAEEAQSIIKTALWIAGISKGVSVLGGLIKNASTAAKAIKAIGTLLTPGGAVVGGIALAGTAIAGLAALTKKFSAEATLSLTVDESELDNYRVDTHELENTINIAAKAKLEINRGLSDFGTDVSSWLSDGEKETQEELDAYVEKLNGIIATAYNSVSSYQQQKKSELDAQFAAGLISQTEYDAALDTLETQATDMQTDLTTAAAAVSDYVAALVASNKTITEEEIAQLNTLLETLNATSAAVIEATDSAKQAYEYSYQKTAAGVGDESDRQKAVEYIELQYTTDEDSLKEAENAIKSKYAALAVGASESEIETLATQEAEELSAIEEQLAALQEEREKMYAELLAGEMEKAGLTEEDFAKYAKALEMGLNDPIKYAAWRDLYANPGTTDKLTELIELKNFMDEFENADISGIQAINSFFTENTGKDAATLMERTTALEDFFALLTDTDVLESLPEDYGLIGADAVKGLEKALRAGYPTLQATARGLANIITSETRAALKIHSPSRVFADIGRYTMEGLIGGVNSQLERVQNAYRTAVTPAKTITEAPSKPASKAGGTVIHNHINYTAGAGTQREARMLNQKLAEQQRASLIAEGL